SLGQRSITNDIFQDLPRSVCQLASSVGEAPQLHFTIGWPARERLDGESGALPSGFTASKRLTWPIAPVKLSPPLSGVPRGHHRPALRESLAPSSGSPC